MAKLRIAQSAKYQGDEWWEWSIWIDAPPEVLEHIDFVRYTLHHTFPDPVRIIRDRSSKFRLDTAGWGTFRIYALVSFKGGEEQTLSHDLQLLYDDGTPTSA